jgi:hypothetical protein
LSFPLENLKHDEAVFVKGDQFLGLNYNPNSGELILRGWLIEPRIQNSYGMGINDYVAQDLLKPHNHKNTSIIYAPSKDGLKHTTWTKDENSNYEVMKVIRVERANNPLRKQILMQSSSGMNIINDDRNVLVFDALVTNPAFKELMLNPKTSMLVPRYFSPSFIHSINEPLNSVGKAVLDHIAIVDNPVYDSNGNQIAGPAFGPRATLRGACFGNKDKCLNLLQSNSSIISSTSSTTTPSNSNLAECVSCPIQLGSRLIDMYRNIFSNYISYSPEPLLKQSSSSTNNLSENNNPQQTQTQNQNPQNTSQQNINYNSSTQSNVANALSAFLTNPNSFTSTDTNGITGQTYEGIIGLKQPQGAGGQNSTNVPTNDKGQLNPQNTNNNSKPIDPKEIVNQFLKDNPNYLQELIQKKPDDKTQTNVQDKTSELVEKLKAAENVKLTPDNIEQISNVVKELKLIAEESINISKQNSEKVKQWEIQKEKEEKIMSKIPQSVFTDGRGKFNEPLYNDLVNYLHSKNIHNERPDLLTVIVSGIIAIKEKTNNKQLEQYKDNIAKSERFGATINNPNNNNLPTIDNQTNTNINNQNNNNTPHNNTNGLNSQTQ